MLAPRDPAAPSIVEPEGSVRRARDPDPRRHLYRRLRGSFSPMQSKRRMIEPMPLHFGAHRERLGEPGRTVGEFGAAAAAPHDIETLDGLERSQEHAGREALRSRDHVQKPVDAVVAVDVRGARRSEQRRVPRGAADPLRRVAGFVLGPGVGFRLDDPADRPLAGTVGTHRATK